MTAITSFFAVPCRRSVRGREQLVVSRDVAEGDDVQITTAAAFEAGGWKDRLARELPGCKAEIEINGHRWGDLVSITTPDGEHVDLAQTPARPMNSLVRHATRTQLRLINALMTAGLVLARM